MTHFLSCKNRSKELVFDQSQAGQAKSIGMKPLEFGLKDSLLYAVSQIIAHLPGIQDLAFSEEWKTFYEVKKKRYNQGSDKQENFIKFFSAFHDYLN
jgi:hypothetical protein